MRSMLSPSRVAVVLCFGTLALAGVVVNTHAFERRPVREDLPLIGSGTGTPFSRDCPDNHVLSGIRYRKGLLLDAVGIKCRPVRSDGTLGPEINSGSMAGGNGGTAGSASCPSSVLAAQLGAGPGVGINTLILDCHQWFPASKTWGGGRRVTSLTVMAAGAPAFVTSTCPRGTAPATGIRGRHGSIVDAFGLRCTTP